VGRTSHEEDITIAAARWGQHPFSIVYKPDFDGLDIAKTCTK
jgi:hypothetical protein